MLAEAYAQEGKDIEEEKKKKRKKKGRRRKRSWEEKDVRVTLIRWYS